MMEIQGEYGSGSGTIVRLSLALSAITGKEIKITDIRAKRPNPGLRHQHLEVARIIAKMCSARIEGDQVGSKEILFSPGKIKGGNFEVNIETAGSIGLLSYATLLTAIFAKTKTTVNIKGGSTASMWSPPIYYMENVLLPILSYMGVKANFEIKKHGFYPKGGAEVILEINGVENLKPLILTERGDIEKIEGLSIASFSLKRNNVAERQINGYHRVMKDGNIKTLYVETISPGSLFIVWAKTSKGCIISGDCVGEERKPAEVVGEEAAFKLKEAMDYGSTVDSHLADQLIPFLALANGKSEIIAPELSEHTKTNIWLCEKFLETKFKTKEEGENFRIVCYGKG